MRYVVKKAGKDAVICEKQKLTLKDLQSVVGGMIEPVYIGSYIFYVHDEGKLKGLLPNILLLDNGEIADALVGDVLITKSDGHGGDASMTQADAERVLANMNDCFLVGQAELPDGTKYDLPTIELRLNRGRSKG